jgi:hypothetical protein
MPRLDFEPVAHRYALDGRPLPSVTQILDPLLDWTGVPRAILDAARLFGQQVHAACDLYDNGVLDWQSLDPHLAAYVRGWQKFLQESAASVVISEYRVFDARLGYAGTLDAVVDWKGVLWLIDRKSGAVPPTTGPQTAAYANALRSMGSGFASTKRGVVALQPDGYKFTKLDRAGDWNLFLSALNCHKFITQGAL